MLEAMKSLIDEMLSFKKASESDVVKTSDSAKARPKPGPSNQPDPILTLTSISRASDHSDVQPMDTDFCGPPLPPKSSQNVQYERASKQSDIESDHYSESEHPKKGCPKAKKYSHKRKAKVRAKYYSQSSYSEEDESSAPTKKPTKPPHKAPQEPEHQESSLLQRGRHV